MGCIVCGKEIGPIRSIRDNEFCTNRHRQLYRDRLSKALGQAGVGELHPAGLAGFATKLAPVEYPAHARADLAPVEWTARHERSAARLRLEIGSVAGASPKLLAIHPVDRIFQPSLTAYAVAVTPRMQVSLNLRLIKDEPVTNAVPPEAGFITVQAIDRRFEPSSDESPVYAALVAPRMTASLLPLVEDAPATTGVLPGAGFIPVQAVDRQVELSVDKFPAYAASAASAPVAGNLTLPPVDAIAGVLAEAGFIPAQAVDYQFEPSVDEFPAYAAAAPSAPVAGNLTLPPVNAIAGVLAAAGFIAAQAVDCQFELSSEKFPAYAVSGSSASVAQHMPANLMLPSADATARVLAEAGFIPAQAVDRQFELSSDKFPVYAAPASSAPVAPFLPASLMLAPVEDAPVTTGVLPEAGFIPVKAVDCQFELSSDKFPAYAASASAPVAQHMPANLMLLPADATARVLSEAGFIPAQAVDCQFELSSDKIPAYAASASSAPGAANLMLPQVDAITGVLPEAGFIPAQAVDRQFELSSDNVASASSAPVAQHMPANLTLPQVNAIARVLPEASFIPAQAVDRQFELSSDNVASASSAPVAQHMPANLMLLPADTATRVLPEAGFIPARAVDRQFELSSEKFPAYAVSASSAPAAQHISANLMLPTADATARVLPDAGFIPAQAVDRQFELSSDRFPAYAVPASPAAIALRLPETLALEPVVEEVALEPPQEAGFVPLEYYCERLTVVPVLSPEWTWRPQACALAPFGIQLAGEQLADLRARKAPVATLMPSAKPVVKSNRLQSRLMELAAAAVLLVALTGFAARFARIGTETPDVKRDAAAPMAKAGGPLQKVRHAIANRAAVELSDTFHSGMEAWGQAASWAPGWTRHSEGYVQTGQLALFQPSMKFTDYRMEFFGQIESKSIGWVVRAHDRQNYYAMKFTVVQPGLRPTIAMVHYAVTGGHTGRPVETPLTEVMVHNNTPYHVAVTVQGSLIVTSIEGQEVDRWVDDRIPTGGVGFYSDAGERARLYWMKVSKNEDFLGKVCAYLSGSADSSRAFAMLLPPRWNYGNRSYADNSYSH